MLLPQVGVLDTLYDAHGVAPGHRAFDVLLRMAKRLRRPQLAAELLERMAARGLEPTQAQAALPAALAEPIELVAHPPLPEHAWSARRGFYSPSLREGTREAWRLVIPPRRGGATPPPAAAREEEQGEEEEAALAERAAAPAALEGAAAAEHDDYEEEELEYADRAWRRRGAEQGRRASRRLLDQPELQQQQQQAQAAVRRGTRGRGAAAGAAAPPGTLARLRERLASRKRPGIPVDRT